ncbi:MAG: protease inhibitor I42 family protein [Lentisphaeria bacterium]|nr:protease inhibitor I42 family protein [Lentisphaeria bacterium]
MIRICSILLMLFLFALTGCRTTGGFTHDLTEKDSGSTLNLEPGDTIRIVLESNPSTGYLWGQDGTPDSDVIRLFNSQFQKIGKTKAVGTPGKQEFIYKAVGHGEAGIRLSLKRPWENNRPQATFQLRIVIKQEVSFLDRLDRRKQPLRRVDSKGRVAPPLNESYRQ